MSLLTGPIRACPRSEKRDYADRVLPVAWEFNEGDSGRVQLAAPWIDAADTTARTAFAWALPDSGQGGTTATQHGVGEPTAWTCPPSPVLVLPPRFTRGMSASMSTTKPRVGEGGQPAADVKEPLLFILPRSAPAALVKTFLESLTGNRRVYVLADLGFGVGSRDPGLRDRSGAWALVRRTSLPLLPAVIGCTSRKVTLLVGPLGESARSWAVELDDAQREGFTRVAFHLFWHHAMDEAWTDPQSPALTFKEPEERPADFIPPAEGPVQWLRRPVDRVMPREGAVWLRNELAIVPPNVTPRRFVTRPSGDAPHFDGIRQLAERGAEVVALAEPMPDLWVTSETGVIEWTLDHYVLRLTLNLPQARPLFEALVKARPQAILRRNLKLKEVAGKVWIPGSAGPAPCVPCVQLPAGDVECETLDAVMTAEPRMWPEVPTLARQVEFSWKNLPPIPPAKAARSPLYQQWEELRSTVQSRLDTCRKTLARVAQQSDEAKSNFGSFFAGVLGFDRRRQELSAEIEKLRSTRVDGTAMEPAKALLETLYQVESGVSEYQRGVEADVSVADHKSQQARWEKEKEENQKRLAATQLELNVALQKKSALDAELAAGQRPDEEQRDWQARQNKLKDDLKELEAKKKKLEARCRDLQHQIDRPFQYKASGQRSTGRGTGKGFVPEPPATSSSIQLPPETLPRVGELVEDNKQRFLVIDTWEQLESGRQEAQRLKARLVARQR